MTWPVVVSIFLLSAIVIGAIGVGLTLRYWSSVGRLASDVAVKVASTVVKFLAGCASVGGAYAAADKNEWWFPAVAGLLCVVVWDVLEKLIDSRVKAADKIDKQSLAAEQKQSETLTELLTVFRESVADKTKRLMKKLPQRRVKPSAALVRAALTPEDHLGKLLEALAAFLAEQLPPDAPATTNFRIGLYTERGGTMIPLWAVNLNNPTYDVFRSHLAHAAAFRLDCTDHPSHAVKCATHRQTVIVEDCVGTAEAGEFHFFNENQRSYLRSMLAYYLGDVCRDDGTTSVAALVIDTDFTGYFKEEDRAALEFCLREFAVRVKLELLLQSMLTEREPTP